MFLRCVFIALAFIETASIPEPAHAASSQAECFARHEPARALAYHVDKWKGQGAYSALVGARVFFWAEPGLTGEWLHRQLAERIAQRRTDTQCPLDVPGVSIRVQSAGPGFLVDISADEGAPAAEVLRRAKAIIIK
jgi:hypothetical protein